MENKTNNRFVTTSSGAGSRFLTVCCRRIQSDTRTSTQRHTRSYLFISFEGVNKDQVKTGSPQTARGSSPGVDAALGLQKPQVAAYSCQPPPFMHVCLWFTRETSCVQWGSRKGGRVAGQGCLTPPPTRAGAAKVTHPPKRVNSGMAWALAQVLAEGAGSPCWVGQAILRLLNISGRAGSGGTSG